MVLQYALLVLLVVRPVCSRRGGESSTDGTDPQSTSAASTSTSASSSALPSPSVSIQFTAPNNTTTCGSTTFFWSSTGLQGKLMSLIVTNSVVPNHTESANLVINETISDNITVATQEFTWLTVDVPEGWYAVEAFSVGVSNISSQFFVQNGANNTCLLGSNSNTATSVTPAPSPTTLPTPPKSHSLGTGPVIGTILGAITALVLISIAFRFPRWWRHALPTPKSYLLY